MGSNRRKGYRLHLRSGLPSRPSFTFIRTCIFPHLPPAGWRLHGPWLRASASSKFKSWRVTASLPWGGLLFVTGFVVREVSVRNDHDLGLLIASTVLFQFAPSVILFLLFPRVSEGFRGEVLRVSVANSERGKT